MLYVKSIEKNIQLQLFDINGKEIYRSSQNRNFELDVSQYQKGIYFLKLNQVIKKIVIQ